MNSSWTAAKLMFDKGCIRTYIFGFWLLRCFIIEILKGEVIYSFLIVFHAILIYGSDTWYICNRKVLLLNIVLYLSIICYSFFVSISPAAPSKPVWTFLNVKMTANSLSRSGYFNLFVIFFDALIVTLFDTDRSKFMMLVKKRKREVLEVPLSRVRMLRRLWIMVAVSLGVAITIYIIEAATAPTHADTASSVSKGIVSRINEGLYSGLLGGVGGFCILFYSCIVYHSSGSVVWKTLQLMMHERRVLFHSNFAWHFILC